MTLHVCNYIMCGRGSGGIILRLEDWWFDPQSVCLCVCVWLLLLMSSWMDLCLWVNETIVLKRLG